MDMSSNGEHSSLASEVDWFYQPDTPPERKVDDAATSSLAGAYEELNEVIDVAIHTALGEATDAPMDASWAVTAGEYRAAPGSCNFLNVVVLMPEDRTVAIVCSVHCEWVKSPKNHVAKKHIGVEFPPELFANFNICKLWPNFESAPLALPCVAEQSGVRCPASNKITLHASSLKCCDSRHSPESLLSVTVQRLGEGSWLQAVEVVSRGHAAANPDAGTARENRRLAISNARSAPLLAAHTNRRKVSPMYQKLNWYTDDEQVSSVLSSGLARLFEVPADVGDPVRWTLGLESLLFDLQVYCNTFSPRFHVRTDYSVVTDKTMRRYAEGITRILNSSVQP
jgi:hypothetical protein